jgi:hypothetical protein
LARSAISAPTLAAASLLLLPTTPSAFSSVEAAASVTPFTSSISWTLMFLFER